MEKEQITPTCEIVREICTGTINVYRRAFADPPWNEGRKCASCGMKYPTLVTRECCGVETHLFWTDDSVRAALAVAQRQRLLVVAKHHEVPIGLAAAELLTMTALRLRLGAHDLLSEHTDDQQVIYLTDLAVAPDRQYRGIGKQLFVARQDCIVRQGHVALPQIVRVRKSNPAPSITYQWYSSKGGEVIYHYPDDDGRAIMRIFPERVIST